MRRLLLITAPVILLFSASCTKTGPAGPRGDDGNANIVVDTLTVTSTQWAIGDDDVYDDSTEGIAYTDKSFDITFPAITQGVIDSGMVAVYFTPANHSTDMEPLPFQVLYEDNILQYDYKVELGVVHLFIYFTRLGTVYPSILTYGPGTHTFKVVAMSGHL